jgi:hypothetical protein
MAVTVAMAVPGCGLSGQLEGAPRAQVPLLGMGLGLGVGKWQGSGLSHPAWS